ncbi:methyl jasmonate esterase 1-like [Syzygium oleosum]|uniref:methyl jasmonate esterase 1-like n=1 Tax=Syzygium oleosum TaxID=219896 RepID=UPI0024B93392|nr:methyl jasmonate esterase 1-like [Syzygium oleosum]XP_056170939.1 methyl jasmonate esterase 1-like [Syzygium oleosum]
MANKETQREKHFVLVHGAGHGAWCWYRVATLLKSSGHKVTALDMAASGVHPKQAQELNSIVEYAQPLFGFLEGLPPEEKVILVGHSMGGLVLSMAMERFPEKVDVAVFAAAFMPGPELGYHSIIREHARRMEYRRDSAPAARPPTSMSLGYDLLSSKLYQLSPPEDLTLASSLVRPFRLYPDQAKMEEEVAVTTGKYGGVRRLCIVCDQDLTITEGMQRWMVEMNPPDEVMVISDSDHMVMFSKPQELHDALGEIAERYCS